VNNNSHNRYFGRFFNRSTISTRFFTRREVCGFRLSLVCAAPASLILPNQFDRLFGSCGTNRFGGGFMGGMTFLPTEVIAATGRASYQVEHHRPLLAVMVGPHLR
jgi:hypothetical protein